jgi:hypothetical protein
MNHGVSRIVGELLTFNMGSEFYRYDGQISARLEGKEFAEAATLLTKERIVLLALETEYSEDLKQPLSKDTIYKLPEQNRAMIVNPQSQYQIRQGDALFIIAESRPTTL